MDADKFIRFELSTLQLQGSPPKICFTPAPTTACSLNPNVPVEWQGGSECLTQDAGRKQVVKCVTEGMVEAMASYTPAEAMHDTLAYLPYSAPKPAPPPPPSALTSQEINSKPYPEDERNKFVNLFNTLSPPPGLAAPAGMEANTNLQPLNGGVLPPALGKATAENQEQEPAIATVVFPDGTTMKLPYVILKGNEVPLFPSYIQAPTAAPAPSTSNSKDAEKEEKPEQSKPYIKKPPNAYMLFLKDERLKPEYQGLSSRDVSAAVGLRWCSLTDEEKASYFAMASDEKELHFQLHPQWSNGDNYGKKRYKEERKKNSKQHKRSES